MNQLYSNRITNTYTLNIYVYCIDTNSIRWTSANKCIETMQRGVGPLLNINRLNWHWFYWKIQTPSRRLKINCKNEILFDPKTLFIVGRVLFFFFVFAVSLFIYTLRHGRQFGYRVVKSVWPGLHILNIFTFAQWTIIEKKKKKKKNWFEQKCVKIQSNKTEKYPH